MRKVLIRFSTALLVVLMFVCMIVGVAYAATTTIGTFNVVESGGNTHIKYPFFLSVNNAGFAATGDISLTGLDTRVTSSDIPLPHMLTTDKTLFIGSVNPSSTTKFKYTAGNVNLSAFNIIVGEGGFITVADAAAIELHDHYNILLGIYLRGVGAGDLFCKLNAVHFTYDGTSLTFITGDEVTPDHTLTATNIAEGLHIVKIESDLSMSTLSLYVDDMVTPKATTGLLAGVPDNDNDWLLYPDPYWTYFKLEVTPAE